MQLTEEQEEIREAIWQKHKAEEISLIREIEQTQRILKELQTRYKLFEEKIMTEVEIALQLQVVIVPNSPDVSLTSNESNKVIVPESNIDSVVSQMSLLTIVSPTIKEQKSKMKCSLCKAEGHNKRSCKVQNKK